MNYKPYDCEVCKCCSEKWNSISDYSDVTCNKYQVTKSTYPRSINIVNDKIYQELKSFCKCSKCYPSKWKMFCFKINSLILKHDDKKYHRNEK